MAANTDDERTYADGERIVGEGDRGREMFIVASGRVRIAKRVDDAEVTIDHVERGGFFGEMALLESLPRFASAYADGDTRVIVIEPGGLLVRIRRDPTFAVEMLHSLSGRLRRANTRIVEMLEAEGIDVPGRILAEGFDAP